MTKDALAGEVRDRIRQAATKVLEVVLDETGGDPMEGIAALLLAAGTAAAWSKLGYSDMVALISGYYEAQLLQEAERELTIAAGGSVYVLPKPSGVQ